MKPLDGRLTGTSGIEALEVDLVIGNSIRQGDDDDEATQKRTPSKSPEKKVGNESVVRGTSEAVDPFQQTIDISDDEMPKESTPVKPSGSSKKLKTIRGKCRRCVRDQVDAG